MQAEIIRINSEPTTYQALISGSIDVVAGAPSGLVMANLQGVPVVSLGSWDNVVPYAEYGEFLGCARRAVSPDGGKRTLRLKDLRA